MQSAPMLPTEIWGNIVSFCEYGFFGAHEILKMARINKQLQFILKQNYFWSTFVNKNYIEVKFNIYESILESANIFHFMKKFLEKEKNENHAYCVLSDVPFIDICQYDSDEVEQIEFSDEVEDFNDINQNDIDKVEQIEFNSGFSNYEDFDKCEITHHNDYFSIADVHYTDLFDDNYYMSIWIRNKFLEDSDENKYNRVGFHIKESDIDFCHGISLHGNYIWFFHGERDLSFYVYDIFTFETKLVYKYIDKIGHMNDIPEYYWMIYHTSDNLLALKKMIRPYDEYDSQGSDNDDYDPKYYDPEDY